MKDLSALHDGDIDRLLSGKAPSGAGIDDLAAFVRGVHAAYVAPPAQEAAARQIATAAAAARQAATPAAAAVPVAEPVVPVSPSSLLSRWRRRTVFGVSVATMTLSLGAATIAATAATGRLAARGDLPGPIQRVVAQAASGVGISLPSKDSAPAPSVPPPGSSQGGPAAGSASAAGSGAKPKSAARLTPLASLTPGRGEHEGSSQPTGVEPTTTSEGNDRQGGRGNGSTGPVGADATSANHSNCVTYAEQIAATLGLSDSQRSSFVSLVDRDPSGTTARVAPGAKPDAACQHSIDASRASAAAGTGGGDDHSGSGHGKDASPFPTPTQTSTASSGPGSSRTSPSPSPSPSGQADHGSNGGG